MSGEIGQFWDAIDGRIAAQVLRAAVRHVWGTVSSAAPLEVLIDGDDTPTAGLEDLAGALVVGDRVLMVRYGRRALILGKLGGPFFTWEMIGDKPSVFPPATHTHSISNISGLAAQLAPMPTAAATGRVSTNTSGEVSVSLPSGRFTSTPRIAATVVSGGLVATTHVRSVSTSSFQVSAWALNTLTRIAVSVDWTATQA